MKSYRMTKNVLTMLKRRYGSVVCYKCGRLIREGQQVVSKQNAKQTLRLYCPECYENLFIDM